MKKNVLLVGGNSSVGRALIKKFDNSEAYHITATFNKLTTDVNLDTTSKIHWERLDLSLNKHFAIWTDRTKGMRFDVVIFLTGIVVGKSIQDYINEEIDLVMNINFSGQAKLVKCLIEYTQMNNNSQFLFVSSVAGEQGSYDSIYAASKSSILGFTKSLAKNLAPMIRTNVIAPGLIQDSRMYNDMLPNTIEKHINETPTKSLLNIDDLANVVYDLTQDHWQHLNGATIDLNGGRYVR